MGLDAFVYCNCFEAGLVHTHPPRPDLVFVAQDGALECRDGGDDEIYFAFREWMATSCPHEDGVLLHRRIGNIALIGLLRRELKKEAEKFPILLGAVLYNGTHGGDYLACATVAKLAPELAALSTFHSPDCETEVFLRGFEQQIVELVEAAMKVKRPIAF